MLRAVKRRGTSKTEIYAARVRKDELVVLIICRQLCSEYSPIFCSYMQDDPSRMEEKEVRRARIATD